MTQKQRKTLQGSWTVVTANVLLGAAVGVVVVAS